MPVNSRSSSTIIWGGTISDSSSDENDEGSSSVESTDLSTDHRSTSESDLYILSKGGDHSFSNGFVNDEIMEYNQRVEFVHNDLGDSTDGFTSFIRPIYTCGASTFPGGDCGIRICNDLEYESIDDVDKSVSSEIFPPAPLQYQQQYHQIESDAHISNEHNQSCFEETLLAGEIELEATSLSNNSTVVFLDGEDHREHFIDSVAVKEEFNQSETDPMQSETTRLCNKTTNKYPETLKLVEARKTALLAKLQSLKTCKKCSACFDRAYEFFTHEAKCIGCENVSDGGEKTTKEAASNNSAINNKLLECNICNYQAEISKFNHYSIIHIGTKLTHGPSNCTFCRFCSLRFPQTTSLVSDGISSKLRGETTDEELLLDEEKSTVVSEKRPKISSDQISQDSFHETLMLQQMPSEGNRSSVQVSKTVDSEFLCISVHECTSYGSCIRCTVCGFFARNKSILKRHLLTTHKDSILTCKVCGETFLSTFELRNHILVESCTFMDTSMKRCKPILCRIERYFAREGQRHSIYRFTKSNKIIYPLSKSTIGLISKQVESQFDFELIHQKPSLGVRMGKPVEAQFKKYKPKQGKVLKAGVSKKKSETDSNTGGLKKKCENDPNVGVSKKKHENDSNIDTGGLKKKRKNDPNAGVSKKKRENDSNVGVSKKKRKNDSNTDTRGLKKKRKNDPNAGGSKKSPDNGFNGRDFKEQLDINFKAGGLTVRLDDDVLTEEDTTENVVSDVRSKSTLLNGNIVELKPAMEENIVLKRCESIETIEKKIIGSHPNHGHKQNGDTKMELDEEVTPKHQRLFERNEKINASFGGIVVSSVRSLSVEGVNVAQFCNPNSNVVFNVSAAVSDDSGEGSKCSLSNESATCGIRKWCSLCMKSITAANYTRHKASCDSQDRSVQKDANSTVHACANRD